MILLVLFLTVNVYADWFINLEFKDNKCEYQKDFTVDSFARSFLLKHRDKKIKCKVTKKLRGKQVLCEGGEIGALILFFDEVYGCNYALRRINKVFKEKQK